MGGVSESSSVPPLLPGDLPATLGALRAAGHRHRTVKQELRDNLRARMRDGAPRFAGIVGYDDTVLPEVERALLAGHDMVLLGERGQGKTRLIRSLVTLLDEWTPVIAGSVLNEHRCTRSPRRLGRWSPRPATTCRSAGCTARCGTGRSWPPRTPAWVT